MKAKIHVTLKQGILDPQGEGHWNTCWTCSDSRMPQMCG